MVKRFLLFLFSIFIFTFLLFPVAFAEDVRETQKIPTAVAVGIFLRFYSITMPWRSHSATISGGQTDTCTSPM